MNEQKLFSQIKYRNNRILFLLIPMVTILSIFLLAGCFNGTPSSTTDINFTLKLYDAVTGLPVSGADVHYGSGTGTTGSDGSVTMTLGSGTSVSDDFGVNEASHYQFFQPSLTLNAGSSSFTVPLTPTQSAISTYTTHNITGRIYELQTSTTTPSEIATGSTVTFTILNSSGGQSTIFATYTNGVDYSINTPTFGTDCLIMAKVTPIGKNPFTVMVKQQDLSGTQNGVNLTQDLAAETTVSVTGQAAGNNGTLYLVSPYGTFSMAGWTVASSPTTITVSNPFNYPGIWVQQQTISNFVAGHNKSLSSASSPAAIGTSATLPLISTSLGPTGGADQTSLAYDSTSKTLSITSVAGAKYYLFVASLSSAVSALILSKTPSVSLPAWISDNFGSGSTFTIAALPSDSDASFDSPFTSFGGPPVAGSHSASISPSSSFGYSKTITIP